MCDGLGKDNVARTPMEGPSSFSSGSLAVSDIVVWEVCDCKVRSWWCGKVLCYGGVSTTGNFHAEMLNAHKNPHLLT